MQNKKALFEQRENKALVWARGANSEMAAGNLEFIMNQKAELQFKLMQNKKGLFEQRENKL